MLHLAAKAFWPARVPFPVLHVDTGHNFPEVIDFRDAHGRAPRPAPRGRRRAGLHRRRPPARARRRHPQPAADAAAARRDRRRPPRRRLRRRPPRRGQGARQGAHPQPARRVRPVGPAQPAPRALGPLQRPAHGRPARARLPDLELDRARRVALHRARGHRAPAALLRARARGVPPRRHVARGLRGVARARRRARRAPHRALPHRRRHELHGRGRVGRRRRGIDVVAEVATSTLTERGATRADDRISEAAMEDRKKDGYF